MRGPTPRARRAGAAAFGLVILALWAGCGARPASRALAIVGVRAIDPASGVVVPNATIVIRGGEIARIGEGAAPPPRSEARRIDGAGLTAIPGLWDAHTHLSKARASSLAHLIAAGVTSVRDVGGDPAELARWRDEIERGERVGPRIFMAGPYLESAARVEASVASDNVEPVERTRWPVAADSDVDAIISRAKAAGADFIKMRTWPSPEVFIAVGRAAERAGVTFAAHVDQLTPETVIDAGLDSVEHSPHFMSEGEATRGDLYAYLAATGGAVTPTLVNWTESILVPLDEIERRVDAAAERGEISRFLLNDWREQLQERRDNAELLEFFHSQYEPNVETLRAAVDAGVTVLAGTDLAVLLIFPGESLHDELSLLVSELGLSELDALRAATVNPATWLERPDLGRLEAGALADLALVRGDPLEDIRKTRAVEMVIARGDLYTASDLERLSRRARTAPDVREDDWSREPAPTNAR